MRRDLYQEITDRIILELQSGAAPWVRSWSLTPCSNRPVNAVTGRHYNGVNVGLLWIAMQARGWMLPRFLTFKQAQELDGTVRRGEHGTGICFFKRIASGDGDDDDAPDHSYAVLKAFTVFNVAQCDGLPEQMMTPDPPKSPHRQAALIEEFLACTGADIQDCADRTPFYTPDRDIICMLPRASFTSDDQFQAARFHELIHWTGHKSRLNRDLRDRFHNENDIYAGEELVAELGAAFLCAEFDIDGDLRHAGYISSWIDLLQRDARAIFTASGKAQTAADYLRQLALADIETNGNRRSGSEVANLVEM